METRLKKIALLLISFAALVGDSNAAPVFSQDTISKPDATIYKFWRHGIGGFTSNTVPGDPVFFRLIDAPDWVEIDQNNGIMTGTPTFSDQGSDGLVVEIYDGMGGTDRATVDFDILPTGYSLFLETNINKERATAFSDYRAGIPGKARSSITGKPLTFYIVSGPAWTTLSEIGYITGVPYDTDAGDNFLIAAVTDGEGTDYAEVKIPVDLPPDYPLFLEKPIQKESATVFTSYRAGIPGKARSSITGDPLSFSLVDGPSWISLSSDGYLTGVPQDENAGINTLAVAVTDGSGIDYAVVNLEVKLHPKYPRWSWDTPQSYIHVGRTPGIFPQSDIDFLARTSNFVCLEKAHALDQLGSTEEGIKRDAGRLKAKNPDMKVLFYMNSILNFGPFYDILNVVNNSSDLVLRESNGNIVRKNGGSQIYNLPDPGFRDWWAGIAGDSISKYNSDGVFADALFQANGYRQYMGASGGSASVAQVVTWQNDQMSRAGDSMRDVRPEGGLVIVNGFRGTNGLQWLPGADGAIAEHFTAYGTATASQIRNDLNTFSSIVDAGKIAIFKGWPDPDFVFTNSEKMKEPYDDLALEARNKISFSLACYLLVAEPYTYFAYSWGYRHANGSLVDYPEFRMPLGKPLGKAQANGWSYTRSFEHADVSVNLQTRDVSIRGLGTHYYNEWLDDNNLPRDPERSRLAEYAVGGKAGLPMWQRAANGGIVGSKIIFRQRRDATARGLRYVMTSTRNLTDGQWVPVNQGALTYRKLNNDIDEVTFPINSDEGYRFYRLEIEGDE
ncbi:MAG: putative glycoside hydrolase [Haloferula sp.]